MQNWNSDNKAVKKLQTLLGSYCSKISLFFYSNGDNMRISQIQASFVMPDYKIL